MRTVNFRQILIFGGLITIFVICATWFVLSLRDESAKDRGKNQAAKQGDKNDAINAKADGKGRVVALEIMIQTQTIREYIRTPDKTIGLKDVIEKGRSNYGMQSFDQHLSELYKAGTISIETAKSAASNPADFERALNFE